MPDFQRDITVDTSNSGEFTAPYTGEFWFVNSSTTLVTISKLGKAPQNLASNEVTVMTLVKGEQVSLTSSSGSTTISVYDKFDVKLVPTSKDILGKVQVVDSNGNIVNFSFVKLSPSVAQKILPTADIAGLQIQGFGGSADNFDIFDSAANPLFAVNSAGSIVANKNLSLFGGMRIGSVSAPAANTLLTFDDTNIGTFTSSPTLLYFNNNSLFGAANLVYKYIAVGQAGSLDLNGFTPTSQIVGLAFLPGLKNTPATAVTLTSLYGVQSGAAATQVGSNITITAFSSVRAQGILTANRLTSVGTWKALEVPAQGAAGSIVTTILGLDIGALTGVTKIGIREQSTGTNRLNGLTRLGDQTTPVMQTEVNGGFGVRVVTVTTTYQALTTDHYLLADATTAAFTVTLPTSSGSFNTNVGQRLSIKKKDSTANAVTIAASGADTIQGAASVALAAQYNERTLYTDGSGTWYLESSL